jgi:hypothetical protein
MVCTSPLCTFCDNRSGCRRLLRISRADIAFPSGVGLWETWSNGQRRKRGERLQGFVVKTYGRPEINSTLFHGCSDGIIETSRRGPVHGTQRNERLVAPHLEQLVHGILFRLRGNLPHWLCRRGKCRPRSVMAGLGADILFKA